MSRSTETRGDLGARAAIIRAAETLFADRGIDGVSMREINRAAGQRNTNAVQYHFGDRDGVLRAILGSHLSDVALRRLALLDQYRAASPEVRAICAALVRPIASKLHDDDGGREFLQIAAEIVNRSNRIVTPGEPSVLSDPSLLDESDSINQWGMLVTPFIPREAAGHPLHRRYTAVRFAHLECGRRAKEPSSGDHRLFTNQLIDLLVAIVTAPVSPETKLDVAARRAKRRQRQ
ncbi:MAG: TetR/AcrR family transcriptional regulator [Desertimonas sp.]